MNGKRFAFSNRNKRLQRQGVIFLVAGRIWTCDLGLWARILISHGSKENRHLSVPILVAGAGFEPATFRLCMSILRRWITCSRYRFYVSIGLSDSKEPVEFWLSQSTSHRRLYNMTKYFFNALFNNICFLHLKPTLRWYITIVWALHSAVILICELHGD